jgi:hypothetical protein
VHGNLQHLSARESAQEVIKLDFRGINQKAEYIKWDNSQDFNGLLGIALENFHLLAERAQL